MKEKYWNREGKKKGENEWNNYRLEEGKRKMNEKET